MNVTVTCEHRFSRLPDGTVWTSSALPYAFWTRYLDVFHSVRAVGRIQDVECIHGDWIRADGESVQVCGVPHYLGPAEFLRKRVAVQDCVSSVLATRDAVILRCASTIGNLAASELHRSARPYVVEVVCDPWDVFAPEVVRHPFRAFFRWWFTRHLKRQCQRAIGVSYVTRAALQRRYPPGSATFATSCSDVSIPVRAITAGRCYENPIRRGRVRLITVGSLAQRYKGVDVLIKAVRICRSRGIDLELVIVGGGKYQEELIELAEESQLGDCVYFKGELPGSEAVSKELDNSDLFVLASRTEGLPRVMIEAMARALPCLGTAVGGIPELLPSDCLVPAGDSIGLAEKIIETIRAPEQMARLSRQNAIAAQQYAEELIRDRRNAFYRHIRTRTEQWLSAQENAAPAVPAAR